MGKLRLHPNGKLDVQINCHMNYLKYYSLEDYLFSDVTAAFHERGYLTPEEFFSIVIWKANRAKSRIKRKLLARNKDLPAAVRELAEEIRDAPGDRDRLTLLLEKWRLALPMASAILTALYPDRSTVYDVRARLRPRPSPSRIPNRVRSTP